MGGELVAGLVVLLQLLVVNGPDPKKPGISGPALQLTMKFKSPPKIGLTNARRQKPKKAGSVTSLYGQGMLVSKNKVSRRQIHFFVIKTQRRIRIRKK